MKYWISIATLLLAAPVWAQQAAPVGLLSLVKGTVQILRAGQAAPTAARIADLIWPGDRVITSPGSEASFLFCPQSISARVPSSSEVAFSGTALEAKRGKVSDERKMGACRLPATLALSAASQQQVGLIRTRAATGVNLRTPSRTYISSLRPQFRWLPVDGAKSYEVRVTDREERTLYKATVTGTQVEYPPDAPGLAWGSKYWWRVVARDGDETLAEAGTFFQTLNDAQYKEFRTAEVDLRQQITQSPNDNGPRFLLAFLYEENGLLEEAVRSYAELTDRLGPNDWLNFQTIKLLNRLGWEKVER